MATKALFNTVVNWFIRQRIDQIQNFMDHPIETQKGILFSQLFHAEDTEYGKTMASTRFRAIRTLKTRFLSFVMKILNLILKKQGRVIKT
jgi:hypothetical protein